jgi:hypothetical protein
MSSYSYSQNQFYKNTANKHNRIVFQCKYKNNSSCSLCLYNMRQRPVKWLPCGHHFHCKCFNKLINSNCDNKFKCPECRKSFNSAIPCNSNNNVTSDDNNSSEEEIDDLIPAFDFYLLIENDFITNYLNDTY